jgi:hypothetical protein
MRIKRAALTALIATVCATSIQAQNHKYDTWDNNYTVQGLLGAVKFRDLDVVDSGGTGDPVTIDISTIPQIGGAWTTLPKGNRVEYGLECSFLLGFRFDNINYLSSSTNGLQVGISTSMWMFDFAGGAYANLFLNEGKTVRVYVGGGPLMTYVSYDSDRTENRGSDPETYNTSESAFGLGLYARTGFEVRVHERGMLGLGIRGTWSNVDLSEISSSSDLIGTSVFATYTAGF